MDAKICPILGAGPVEVNTNCKGERCAWIATPTSDNYKFTDDLGKVKNRRLLRWN